MDLNADPSGSTDNLPQLGVRVAAAFAVLSLLTWAVADTLDILFVVVCSVFFAVGIALFLLGFWNGVQRSRVDDVTLTGLLALGTSYVGARPRNLLWAAIAIETVVAILFASLRPFTQQAFGLLMPMFGVGLATLWGSRAATFHPRDDPRNPSPRSAPVD
jgi:hypothetical protein